jgi:tripartite-type tricarboxylate transporter receptor subunit TctC
MKKMRVLLSIVLILMAGIFSVGDCLASAEKFPEQPIEWIIRWSVGGGSSRCARAFAKPLKKELDTPIAIINIPGASGAVGMVEYMKRPSDGYSILGIETDLIIASALGTYKYKVDELDFIGRIQMDSAWVLTRPDSPYKGFDDVVAAAKKRPNKIKLGGIGLTSSDALAIAKLSKMGIKIKFIAYDGGSELHAALFRGDVDIIWEEVSDVLHYVQNGQMRPLVAAVAQKIQGFPDLPTMKELGFDIDLPFFRGIAVKKGTDPAVLNKLSQAVIKATEGKEWSEYMIEKKMDANQSRLNSKEFGEFINQYYKGLKQIIDETGFTIN